MPKRTFPGDVNTYNFYSFLVHELGTTDGSTLERVGKEVAPRYGFHHERVDKFRSEIRNSGAWRFAGGRVVAADDERDQVGRPLRLRWVRA